MRIGMMTDYYKTHVSGVSNFVSLSKRCLEDAGNEVYIFTFDKAGAVADEKNVIYTSGIPVTDFFINFSYNQNAKQLLSTMDIVHVHHPFISGILAKRYCLPKKIPIVFTNHSRYDLYSQAYLPIIPRPISEAGLKAYLTRFFNACDLVVIPSPSMHQVLTEKFDITTAVDVIPNGIDLSLFCGHQTPIDRQLLGLSNNDIISIYVGRLAPEKNLPFLLRAFRDASQSNPHLRLLIVGDGPERKNLETQAKQMGAESRLIFTGLLPYNDIPHYLAASDLFVSASITEVFPLTIIEAKAAGLPVLGIDSPGIIDIIEDGNTGVISKNEFSDFTSKLLHLSNDHEMRQKMGRQARQSIEKYDIKSSTGLLLSHYRRLVANAQHNQNSQDKGHHRTDNLS